ncbi:MAG: hypothetical protein RJB39_412 [Candidatus Parcubacteria bacterium]|jgi:hypothetical protein
MKKTYFLTLAIVAVLGFAQVNAFALTAEPTGDSSDGSALSVTSDSSDGSTIPSGPSEDSSDGSGTPATEGPTQDSSDGSGDQPTVPPTTPPTTTPPTTITTAVGPMGGGGSSGGFTSGGLTVGTPISATATSTVIGINPNCSQLFKTYMGYGKSNNKVEVIRLQAFLNRYLKANLAVSGIFEKKTQAAVKLFQTKHASTILLPWDVAGLSTNLVANPTGYVYKTTQHQLNLLVCPAFSAPAPMLP